MGLGTILIIILIIALLGGVSGLGGGPFYGTGYYGGGGLGLVLLVVIVLVVLGRLEPGWQDASTGRLRSSPVALNPWQSSSDGPPSRGRTVGGHIRSKSARS